MIKTILLPLDGSVSTLDYAIHLARKSGAVITALAITDEPEFVIPEPVLAEAGEFANQKYNKLMAIARERNQDLLHEFKKTCDHESLKFAVIEKNGHPHEVVNQLAHEHDIVVMPLISHFKFITQDEPCKTSEQVIHHTARPIFLVPEKIIHGNEAWITFDGGKAASRTMQLAHLTGLLNDLKTTAIAVNEDRETAEKHCRTVAEFMNHHDIPVTEKPLVSEEKPWHVLLHSLKAPYPEFITMGAFEKTGIKEFFLGSFTKGLLEKSPVPLFIYR